MNLGNRRGQLAVWTACAMLLGTVLAHAADAPKGKLPANVVARQGTAQVTLEDIDAWAQRMPEADRAGFFDNPKRIQSVILNLLLTRQLAQEARDEKLDRDAQVKLRLQQAADDVLAHQQMEHVRKDLKLPDFSGMAQEYYLSHKADYAKRGAVDVQHVMVSATEHSDADAKARIGEVEAAARAHPEHFDALVEKYTDDAASKANHGLIEDAALAKKGPAFAKAVVDLKNISDVSPVVKSDNNYYVLKLVARKADEPQSFEQVRDGLIEKLRKDYIDRQVSDHTDQLRNKPLDANPDVVASLRTRYLPAGATLLPEDASKSASAAPETGTEPQH
jgi:parvulin-like peptidyl-prolyl isomerase